MKQHISSVRELGQGMTEYIIIVALIAIAAIGVYKAFGGVVRGQTAVAASALAGTTAARENVDTAQSNAVSEAAKDATLKNFEK